MVEVVALMNWFHIRMITTEHFTLRGIPLTEATFLLKAAPWRCVNIETMRYLETILNGP